MTFKSKELESKAAESATLSKMRVATKLISSNIPKKTVDQVLEILEIDANQKGGKVKGKKMMMGSKVKPKKKMMGGGKVKPKPKAKTKMMYGSKVKKRK